MNIPSQLQKVRIVFTDYRFVPVLKKMPLSQMPPVKPDNVSSENLSHARKKGTIASPNEQMKMVRNESPSINLQGLGLALGSQTIQEVVPVFIRPEYVCPFYPPSHHMMQRPWSIESRLSRHMPYTISSPTQSQVVFEPTSPFIVPFYMLRAAVSLLFLRGLHRFSTSGCPVALDACYVTPWRLPRPDLHRLADDDFSGHTIDWLAIISNLGVLLRL